MIYLNKGDWFYASPWADPDPKPKNSWHKPNPRSNSGPETRPSPEIRNQNLTWNLRLNPDSKSEPDPDSGLVTRDSTQNSN